MPEIQYNLVAKKPGQFPPSPLPNVILLIGADDALKREALAKLRSVALDEAFADFDQETVDFSLGSAAEDANDPVSRIFEACGSAPFSSPRRVVTVISVQKLSKERQDALANTLQRLPSLALLILIADASEMEAGKPKGKQLELALRKAVAKSGLIVACEPPEGADLRSRATEMIASSGKTFDPQIIELLIAASTMPGQNGADVNALRHESAKLLAYAADHDRITKDDAASVLPLGTDENIFRLLDCIGSRDVSRAMFELDALLLAENKPDATAARLIVMLQRHFRQLIFAKFLSDHRLIGRNQLPDDLKSHLTPELIGLAQTQSYRMNGYAKQAANFRWDELTANIGRILFTDLSLKGIMPGIKTMPTSPDFGDDAASTLRLLILDLCWRGK